MRHAAKHLKNLRAAVIRRGVRLPRVLIVSRTRMQSGLCIGAFDLATNESLRLLPEGRHAQPEGSPLQIGEIWEVSYGSRQSAPPFTEDVDAAPVQLLGTADVQQYVDTHLTVAVGDTTMLYSGLLGWNTGGKGYIEPQLASRFSTEFWRPTGVLYRNEGFRAGSSVFREAATNHRIPWVGVAEPPQRIEPGTLVRVSLGRAYPGTEDHPVCWLQISGVY